jgi:hypothetical protein
MYQNIPVINGYPKGKTTRSFTLFSLQCLFYFSFSVNICTVFEGRIQDFKLGGGALKKIAPSGGRREHFWGISCEKSRFCAKKSYFFPILEGVRARCAPPPPWIRPCIYRIISYQSFLLYITDISRHCLPIRNTWMHPCVVGVRVAHICFSFFLFVSSRSLCYFCSAIWLRYLIYDFLFIPQFFLPFLIIFVHLPSDLQ